MSAAAVRLSKIEMISYLVLQQGLWFLLVIGAAKGHYWWPSAVVLALLAAACWRAGPAWWRVMTVIGIGIGCALAVDGSLHKIGIVGYAGADPAIPLPPLWIIVLWGLFAGTLALPARAALTSPIAAGILGLIGGPLAYAGGRTFGALEVSNTGLMMVGACYALATPMIVLFANRLLPVPPPTVERPRTGPQAAS